jgi:elongation factor P
MVKAGSITKGMFLQWRGEPVLVVDKEFFNPGKGSAVVRLKLKNLKTGNVVKEVLRTDEMVDEIQVNHRKVQFLYKNGDQFVFIDPKTYEQIEVEKRVIGESEKFIKEGEKYSLAVWEDQIVSITLPKKIVFEVVNTEAAARGDTVTGATKLATLDNGAVVKVPLFIKKGEKVIVNTETGEYVGRKS